MIDEQVRLGDGLMRAVEQGSPFWAYEKLIAVRYFSQPRSTKTDLLWVEWQLQKEWSGSGVYGPRGSTAGAILAEVGACLAEVVNGNRPTSDLKGLAHRAAFAADEVRHFSQLVDLWELLADRQLPAMSSLRRNANGERLTELRLELREGRVGETAVELSEGGGLGIYFGIVASEAELDLGDARDAKILEVAQRTLDDETGHLRSRILSAERSGFSPAEYEELGLTLARISDQKLRERNEQFGSPLSQAELRGAVNDESAGRAFLREHLPWLASRSSNG